MSNMINDFMRQYFLKNASDNKVDSFYHNINNLYRRHKISLEELDKVCSDVSNAIEYTIKILAKCPNIEVTLKNVSKPQVVYRTLRQPKTNLDAIGFEYTPDDDEPTIDD